MPDHTRAGPKLWGDSCKSETDKNGEVACEMAQNGSKTLKGDLPGNKTSCLRESASRRKMKCSAQQDSTTQSSRSSGSPSPEREEHGCTKRQDGMCGKKNGTACVTFLVLHLLIPDNGRSLFYMCIHEVKSSCWSLSHSLAMRLYMKAALSNKKGHSSPKKNKESAVKEALAGYLSVCVQ